MPTLYRILVGDKYGFMDQSGKVKIEPQFDYVPMYFEDEICWAKINEQFFLIDRSGAITAQFPNTVKYLQQEENGLFIFSTVFSSLDDYLFSGDFENKRMGVLDSNAKIVIPEIYSWVKIFSESGSTIIFVAQELQTDIIDKAVATGSVPELIGDWYYADSDGNIVESTCYNDVEHFSNGLCAVKQDDKWGYIDKTGKMLITPVYDYAGLYAENGIAIVEKDGERMFIDKQGNKLFSVNE